MSEAGKLSSKTHYVVKKNIQSVVEMRMQLVGPRARYRANRKGCGRPPKQRWRPRPLAVRFGTGAAPAGPESLRQEKLTERRRGAHLALAGRVASPERRVRQGTKPALLRSDDPACCRMIRVRFPRRAIANVGLIAPHRPPFARAAREQFEEWPRTTRLDELVLLVGFA